MIQKLFLITLTIPLFLDTVENNCDEVTGCKNEDQCPEWGFDDTWPSIGTDKHDNFNKYQKQEG